MNIPSNFKIINNSTGALSPVELNYYDENYQRLPLYALIDWQKIIDPGEAHQFRTGFSIEIPDPNVFLSIVPISGIRDLNGDHILIGSESEYSNKYHKGPILVDVLNRSKNIPIIISPGDFIGQLYLYTGNCQGPG